MFSVHNDDPDVQSAREAKSTEFAEPTILLHVPSQGLGRPGVEAYSAPTPCAPLISSRMSGGATAWYGSPSISVSASESGSSCCEPGVAPSLSPSLSLAAALFALTSSSLSTSNTPTPTTGVLEYFSTNASFKIS